MPKRRTLKGTPREHVKHAEAYMRLFPGNVEFFEKTMAEGHCDRAFDWVGEAEAKIQAIKVSATHSGRKEAQIRAKLRPLEKDLERIQKQFRKRCLLKTPR